MTRYEQAINELNIATAEGVVRVRDGHTTWLCEKAKWDDAAEQLDRRDALLNDDGDGGAEAYFQLCVAVVAPVVCLDGSDRGTEEEMVGLVVRAVRGELLRDTEPLAVRWIGQPTTIID